MNSKKLFAYSALFVLLFSPSLTKAQEMKPAQDVAPAQAVKPAEVAKPKEEFKPSVKFGALIQAQAQLNQEQTTAAQDAAGYTRHWSHQFQLRRARILANGDITKELSFTTETDITARLGNASATGLKNTEVPSQVDAATYGTSKTNAVNFALLTAYATYKFAPELSIIGGLQNVGVWRYGLLQSTVKSMLVDAPSTSSSTFDNAFNTFGARDIGLTLRGFVLDEKLDYRIGVYEGQTKFLTAGTSNNYSPVRTTAHVNYNFMDVEKGFTYQGTALGKGQYLSVGGGVDAQNGYFGYAVDFYYDQTVFDGAALTLSGAFGRFNGTGQMLKNMPTQQMLYLEAGLFLKESRFQPVAKFEWNKRDANATFYGVATDALVKYNNDQNSNTIIGVGLNYWLTDGYNSSVKLLWEGKTINRPTKTSTNADPKTETQLVNGLTLQWQWFLQ